MNNYLKTEQYFYITDHPILNFKEGCVEVVKAEQYEALKCELSTERKAREHDIKRHVQIATDQANEIVALKAKRREDVRKCEQTTPDFVLADIILDIRSRKGLGDEWDKIDVDDRNYIAHLWREYIKTAIRAAFPEDFK